MSALGARHHFLFHKRCVACSVNRLDQDEAAAGPHSAAAWRGEDDPTNSDAVPVSAVGHVHWARRSLSGRHVLSRLVCSLSQLNVRSQHLQTHLQTKGSIF